MQSKAKRLILVVGAMVIAAAAYADGKLTGVQWKKIGEGVEVQVQGSDLEKPKAFWTNRNRTYVLEFAAHLSGKARTQQVDAFGLDSVKWVWYKSKPPTVRVLFNVDSGAKPELAQSEEGWTVWFGEAGAPKKAAAPKAEPFPETVPPLYAPMKSQNDLAKAFEKLAASPVAALPPNTSGNLLERVVTLEFIGTDIVQILKALSLQANVNIATSPDIKGALSISLAQTTVQQALDYVTTLSGLRYALVGNTFIVTTNERFANVMRLLETGPEAPSQTRVITLASGEGAQIKAAVLKSLPQESMNGRYDIILPTESITLETKNIQASGTAGKSDDNGGSSGVTGGGEAQKTDVTSKAETGGAAPRAKDMYVMLVGLPKRLDEVEKVVREVDTRIADANRIEIGKDITTAVVPIFSTKVQEVRAAIQRVVDRDPKKDLYTIIQSNVDQNPESDSTKLLLISGPKESMSSVELFARGIDEGLCKSMGIEYPESMEAQERGWEILDLNWVEPLEAANELMKHVPGLRASILPSAVRPNPKGARSTSMGNAEGAAGGSGGGETQGSANQFNLGGQGATSGANSNPAGAGGGSAAAADQDNGASLVKNLGSEPMKLIVRGNRSQIAQARDFLAVLDTAPKQVALELRVMELSKEEALKIGLDWSALTGGTVRFIRFNQNVGGTSSSSGTFTSGNPASNLTADQGLHINRDTTASIFGTLDQMGANTKLIARPNVLASEGRPTTIFIGDEVRYVESIQSSQNGTTVTTGQVNVGVKMNVTPRVGSNNNIMLDLNPELSLLRGFLDVPGGGQLPQTSLRSATSLVNMKDGETIAIGGLIQEYERTLRGGIPILKDIPLLGQLFGRTDKSKTRSEIVFFVTAKIANQADFEAKTEKPGKATANPNK